MRYATVDETVWPVDDDGEVQWQLRYGPEPNVVLASFLASYAYLTDPTLPQYAAIAALKRARLAVRETASRDEVGA